MNPPLKSQTNILLADPDEALAASARRVLERRGFSVTLTSDGDQALALFTPETHVVIVSVTLPKKDGLGVLRELKARAPAALVILLTDASSISSAMMGLQEGAFAYLLKPIADYLQLTHAVERALELYQLRSDRAAAPVSQPSPQTIRSLVQLTETLDHTQPQQQLFERVMKAVVQIFGASKAVVLLADGSQNFRLVAGLGNLGQSSAARDFMRVVGEEFAWRVAKERKTLTASSPNKKFVHAGAPLVSRDRLIGVLVIYEIAAGEVNAERLGWLGAFAAQAAGAMELSRLHEENARLAPSDPVTGALNESVFLDFAEREFRRSWRFNEFLSVISIRVEELGGIVRLGQEQSDRIVRLIADICRQSVRNIDLVARSKDDSFTLVLLMTDSQGAQSVAERIWHAVEIIPKPDWKDDVGLSVRLGVTTYPHEGCTSILDLIELAHSAQENSRVPGKLAIAHA